jgi:predicted MFS family arabinose efflux permease
MAGAALTTRAARVLGSARVVWVSLLAAAPFGLLVPLAQPGWSVVLAVVGVAGGELGQLVYAITNVSLRQRLVPERLLGRVNATMRFLVLGAFPLGALAGGLLGAAIGVRGTLWVAAALVLLAPLPLAAALRGRRDVEDLPATAVPA